MTDSTTRIEEDLRVTRARWTAASPSYRSA